MHIDYKSFGNSSFEADLLVGNKTKEQISKRMIQENKARQIFRKTNI